MNTKNTNNFWFTFVELVIVMVIIVILSTIWFTSYLWYYSWAKDTQRQSDLLQVSSALKLYKQKRWYYSLPWNYFNITYSGTTVAYQWKLDTSINISSLEKLPTDPDTKWYYTYWTTTNKQEFLLAWTLENDSYNAALMMWDYKSVSKNILPTLLLATWATVGSDVEIKEWYWYWDTNRKLFIYDQQLHNLPYTFKWDFGPFSDWISFDDLLNEVETNAYFWQNTDYRNCVEIEEAWKFIIPLDSNPFEYQIISNTWALVNTWCTL